MTFPTDGHENSNVFVFFFKYEFGSAPIGPVFTHNHNTYSRNQNTKLRAHSGLALISEVRIGQKRKKIAYLIDSSLFDL